MEVSGPLVLIVPVVTIRCPLLEESGLDVITI